MKFIVSSSQLLKRLQSISGVLNSSNTLPILDNFLFEVKSNELIVSASDLETTMTTQINNTEASEEGNIAIPAKLLMDTLKTFSEQPLTFLVDKSTQGIEIGSDNGKYKLAGQNGEEFPWFDTNQQLSFYYLLTLLDWQVKQKSRITTIGTNCA